MPTWPCFFVFVPGHTEAISEMSSLAIPINPDHDQALAQYEWYDHDTMKGLHEVLGNGFIQFEPATTFVHQSVVVMMEMGRVRNSAPVFGRPWSWLRNESQRPQELLKGPSTMILAFTSKTSALRLDLRNVLERLERIEQIYPACRIRTYPTLAELRHEELKLPDINHLETIAANGPPEYSHRPKTCLPYRACILHNESVTAHKRSHGDGGVHAVLRSKNDRGNLQCTLPHDMEQKIHQQKYRGRNWKQRVQPSGSESDSIWFHQQHVLTLKNVGEYRVSILMVPDPQGMRCPRGEVVHMVRTISDGAKLCVLEADFGEHTGGLLRQDLVNFALHVLSRLQELRHVGHASLEVGVRLDVGLFPGPDGRPSWFVSKITRVYEAYASTLPCPCTQFCERYAGLLLGYLFGEHEKTVA